MSLLQSSVFTATKLPNESYHSQRNSYGCINNVSFSRIARSSVSCYQNGKSVRGYSIFASFLKQPFKFRVPKDMALAVPNAAATATTAAMPGLESSTGIGIVIFLEGKTVFVTGSTGFLAKVFVEKMLRSSPDMSRIFLLIKAKDKDAAMKRFKSEIVESELFKCLEEIHGKSYQDFMLSKLVPVVGNVSEPDLGMDFGSAYEVLEEVDVIVNSAAATTFDERYDMALEANTRGPSRLMSFAKKCKKLKLFVNFSTATRSKWKLSSDFPIAVEIFSRDIIHHPNKLNVLSRTHGRRNSLEKILIPTVTPRARFFGWPNTYTFTKAMGEMVINTMRGDIPVIIIRPSIIKSTYEEPFPGWIQGNRVLDPLITSYGKGLLPGYLADPQVHMDVVPVDMVVNATLAAIAKHGIEGKPGINVYHVASAAVNPLLLCDLFNFAREHFLSSPFMDSEGKKVSVAEMRYFRAMDEFSAYVSADIARKSGPVDATILDKRLSQKLEIKCKNKVEHFVNLARLYEPFMFYKGWFHNGNTQKLMDNMSEEEMNDFGIDFASITWRNYILKVHIPGVRKHVLKGRKMIG